MRPCDAVRAEDGEAYARLRDRANSTVAERKRLARGAGLEGWARSTGLLGPA